MDPAQEPDEENAQASWAGRAFARTGGVSDAVRVTLEKLAPERTPNFHSIQVDGIPNCMKILQELSEGKCEYTFIEGMGCNDGCVGGPGKLVDAAISRPEVESYGDQAISKTPVDNPAIYALLTKLGGLKDFDDLRNDSPIGKLLHRNFILEEKK